MRLFGMLCGITMLATTASASVSLPCGGGTEAEAEAACAAFAKGGHGLAICGGIVALDTDARAEAICGKAMADCEGGDLFLKLSVTEDACTQAQEMSAAATLTAGDTAVSCGDAAQTCGDVAVSCPPAPLCPDIAPTCARWRYRYKPSGAVKSQKCTKWVVPVVGYQGQ